MAENSKIEWCDATFNPWEGCQKVGPGCDNCYAETRNARYNGGTAPNWGPGAQRRRTSAANWAKPLAWNRNADAFQAVHGRRMRVFCSSLADVFDNEVPENWRIDLFSVIEETPHLDWLLLTKRIGNAAAMLPWSACSEPWPNVWLGATVCSQAEADRDITKLLQVPAAVRFLSMEPLLGPVTFEGMFASLTSCDGTNMLEALDWVIVGGESGPGARPMHPDWARNLRDQCAAAGVPFLFKQWGEWEICSIENGHYHCDMERNKAHWVHFDGTTTKPSWHRDGYPDADKAWAMVKVGKKASGRVLDGMTHDGFPEVRRG